MASAASNTGKKMTWKRVVLFNVVLIAISCGFAAGVGEVAIRMVAPQQLIVIRPDLWQPADTVGYLRRPNVNASVNVGEGSVKLITDQDGFRIGAQGRRSGIPVLLLGDSFMEALQVEHENSLAGLLEAALSSGEKTVAVRNAGVSGFAPSQYLVRAKTLLPREDYRLVVTAVYVGNDAQQQRLDYVPPRQQAERHHFRLPKAISRKEIVDAGLRPVNDALEGKSHLFILLRNQLGTLRMKAGVSPLYFPQEFRKSEATSQRWALTADICREISEEAAKHGAKALFVLIPADFQVDEQKFSAYVTGFGIDTATVDLDQPSRLLAQELGSRGLNVVDPLPRFRELYKSGKHLYGTVDQHLSAEGHKALAESVAPAAAQLLTQN
jgi:lysophospholipase L1-like esterase